MKSNTTAEEIRIAAFVFIDIGFWSSPKGGHFLLKSLQYISFDADFTPAASAK
jgi:hypothetical protein